MSLRPSFLHLKRQANRQHDRRHQFSSPRQAPSTIDQEVGAVVVLGRKYRSSANDFRPRPVPIAEASAVAAPPHACGRTPASRSCGHRRRRFPVVGAGRRPIQVLVFFQVSHGSGPRLDANMGANGKRNINPGRATAVHECAAQGYACRRNSAARTRSRNCSGVLVGGAGAGA